MVVVDPGGAEGERAVGGAAVGIGEERVVVHAGGEQSLGQPAHEHSIEIEPKTQRDVTHEQPVAEATDPPQVGVELELQRAPEDVDPRRRLDRVEAGQTRRARRRPSPPPAAPARATTRAGTPERGVHARGARPTRRARASSRRVDSEIAHDGGHEVLQGTGVGQRPLVALRTRVAIGDRAFCRELGLEDRRVALQPLLPVLGPPHDLGRPADPLPARARHLPAPAVYRGGGEQPHDVVALEVAVGEREEAEEPAAERAVGERAHGCTVVRDARRLQLFVHEAGVRLRRAVEHRHAFERHTLAHRVDDQSHQCSHLIVGIRCRDDARGDRGRRRRRRCRRIDGGEFEVEPRDRGAHRRVGAARRRSHRRRR